MELNVWYNIDDIDEAIDGYSNLSEYGLLVDIRDFEFNNGYYLTRSCCEFVDGIKNSYLVNNFDGEVINVKDVSKFMIIKLVDND